MANIMMEILNFIMKWSIFALQFSPVIILVLIQRVLLKKDKVWMKYLLPIIFGVISIGVTFYLMKEFFNYPQPTLIGFLYLLVSYLLLFNVPTISLILTNHFYAKKHRIKRELIQMSVEEV
jgi:hypothetical protein